MIRRAPCVASGDSIQRARTAAESSPRLAMTSRSRSILFTVCAGRSRMSPPRRSAPAAAAGEDLARPVSSAIATIGRRLIIGRSTKKISASTIAASTPSWVSRPPLRSRKPGAALGDGALLGGGVNSSD